MSEDTDKIIKAIKEQTEAIERADTARRLDRECDERVAMQRRKNSEQQAYLDRYARSLRRGY